MAARGEVHLEIAIEAPRTWQLLEKRLHFEFEIERLHRQRMIPARVEHKRISADEVSRRAKCSWPKCLRLRLRQSALASGAVKRGSLAPLAGTRVSRAALSPA